MEQGLTNNRYAIPLGLQPYVKSVLSVQKFGFDNELHSIPYYADGCPGIMYIESDNRALLNKTEKLSSLFLYGQSIKPIEILSKGSYSTIIFYLYPHAIKSLFGIGAHELTDDCLDFELMPFTDAKNVKNKLIETETIDSKIEEVSRFLLGLASTQNIAIDTCLVHATSNLIETNGCISLKTLREELKVSERTFERKFKEYVGISPRMFARICKFQSVLGQLRSADYSKLSDVAYNHDFSDQSHFIRTFKEFTGMTPTEYLTIYQN